MSVTGLMLVLAEILARVVLRVMERWSERAKRFHGRVAVRAATHRRARSGGRA